MKIKWVTHDKADNGVVFVEGLALNCDVLGYHTEIALTASQPLGLEHILPKNFVRLIVVGIC